MDPQQLPVYGPPTLQEFGDSYPERRQKAMENFKDLSEIEQLEWMFCWEQEKSYLLEQKVKELGKHIEALNEDIDTLEKDYESGLLFTFEQTIKTLGKEIKALKEKEKLWNPDDKSSWTLNKEGYK